MTKIINILKKRSFAGKHCKHDKTMMVSSHHIPTPIIIKGQNYDTITTTPQFLTIFITGTML